MQQLQLKNFFKAKRAHRSSKDQQTIESYVVKQNFTKTFNNSQPQFPNFQSSVQSKNSGKGFFKKNKVNSNQTDFILNMDLRQISNLNSNFQNQYRMQSQENNNLQQVYISSQNHCNLIHHVSQRIAVQADKPSSIQIKTSNNHNQHSINKISHNFHYNQYDSSLKKTMSPSSASTHLNSMHFKKMSGIDLIDTHKMEIENQYNKTNRRQKSYQNQNYVQDQSNYNIGSFIRLPTFIIEAYINLKCPCEKQYKTQNNKIQEINRRKIEQTKRNSNVKKFR